MRGSWTWTNLSCVDLGIFWLVNKHFLIRGTHYLSLFHNIWYLHPMFSNKKMGIRLLVEEVCSHLISNHRSWHGWDAWRSCAVRCSHQDPLYWHFYWGLTVLLWYLFQMALVTLAFIYLPLTIDFFIMSSLSNVYHTSSLLATEFGILVLPRSQRYRL